MNTAGNEVWELLMLPSISRRTRIGVAGTYKVKTLVAAAEILYMHIHVSAHTHTTGVHTNTHTTRECTHTIHTDACVRACTHTHTHTCAHTQACTYTRSCTHIQHSDLIRFCMCGESLFRGWYAHRCSLGVGEEVCRVPTLRQGCAVLFRLFHNLQCYTNIFHQEWYDVLVSGVLVSFMSTWILSSGTYVCVSHAVTIR